MRFRHELVVMPILIGAVAACSLVYGGDLSDARDIDAIVAQNNGDGGDAGTDGAPTPQGDAAGNVNADGGEGGVLPARGCASHVPAPRFCQDFDTPPDLADGWTLLRQQNGGELSFDSLAYSGTRSGKVAIADTQGCSYTRFEKSLTTDAKEFVTIRAHVRPEPWIGPYAPFVVRFDREPSFCQLIIYAEGGNDRQIFKASLNNQDFPDGANDIRGLEGFPKTNEWNEIIMHAVPGDGEGVKMRISFIGEDGVEHSREHQLPQCKLGGDVAVWAGFHCDNDSATARYDDIIIDWK